MYDESFSDFSQIPIFLISELTRKYLTVSLSGDGGDELFEGYNRYFLGNKTWNKVIHLSVFIKSKIVKALIILSPENWDSLFNKLNFLLPKFFKQSLPGDKMYKLTDVLKHSCSSDELYKALVSHWKYPENLVVKSKESNTICVIIE